MENFLLKGDAHKYQIELTDTFGGEANYSWVRRASVTVPELTHYGYTGSADGSYSRVALHGARLYQSERSLSAFAQERRILVQGFQSGSFTPSQGGIGQWNFLVGTSGA